METGQLVIREREPGDAGALLGLVAALQDAERAFDASLPAGAEIAAAYLAQLDRQCADWNGAIFVADRAHDVAGFVSVFAAVPFSSADDPAGTYALIGDLVVDAAARQRGVGASLLARAEDFARAAGARELRVEVLARNAVALGLYERVGFRPHLVTARKPLDGTP